MMLFKRNSEAIVVAVLFVLSLFFAPTEAVEKGNEIAADERIYELRTYTTHSGKLDDLLKRFKNDELQLFYNHGLVSIGHWTPADRENTLIYIVSHNSREEAEKNWEAFMNDPEWQKVYEESRVDGPIVKDVESVFMKATSYSQIR